MKRGARPFTKGPFPADLRARFAHIRAGAAPGAPSAPSTAATPSRAASDLEPCDWKAKFDAIKVDPETKTPLWGEISRVAMLPPEVPKETLRRRYETRDVSSTKMGPKPALGVLEDDLLEWLRAYKSMGVHIYTKIVCEKARRLAKAAGLEWDFIASRRWLEGFCTRHKLNLRQGQFLERERAHAVSRESLGRYFDILEEASVGVKPGGIWMLDEVHVNLLDTGGYTVRSNELMHAPHALARMTLTAPQPPRRSSPSARAITRRFQSPRRASTSLFSAASTLRARTRRPRSSFRACARCPGTRASTPRRCWAWTRRATCPASSFSRGVQRGRSRRGPQTARLVCSFSTGTSRTWPSTASSSYASTMCAS